MNIRLATKLTLTNEETGEVLDLVIQSNSMGCLETQDAEENSVRYLDYLVREEFRRIYSTQLKA